MRLNYPQPRVQEGLMLGGLASAAIDVSDGLLADLGHICRASRVGAVVDCGRLPLSDQVRAHVDRSRTWDLPLAGGEDYELCFTVPAASRKELLERMGACGCQITEIGHIEPGSAPRVLQPDGSELKIQSTGFDHFTHEA